MTKEPVHFTTPLLPLMEKQIPAITSYYMLYPLPHHPSHQKNHLDSVGEQKTSFQEFLTIQFVVPLSVHFTNPTYPVLQSMCQEYPGCMYSPGSC